MRIPARRKAGERTHPEVSHWQSFPETRVDHVDQVLPLGGDEGAEVRGQTHRLGLLVAHPVSGVEPHHVARVGLVQRHQVELEGEEATRGSLSGVTSGAFLAKSNVGDHSTL